jgi:hypothetical protein
LLVTGGIIEEARMAISIKRHIQRSGGDTATADVERQLVHWSRAFERLAKGFLSSGMAQIDLARSLCRPAGSTVSRPGGDEVDRMSVHDRLAEARMRFEAIIAEYRRINDGLAANFFQALDSLAEDARYDPAHAADPSIAAAPHDSARPPTRDFDAERRAA